MLLQYITSQGKKNLVKPPVKYEHVSIDNSALSHLLQHFWRWVVEFFPLWFSPNLITVIGLVLQLAAFVVMGVFNPGFDAPVPWYVNAFCAFGCFAFQTLDACDGKQARRTNSSSLLGDYVDHCADSISIVIMIMTAAACMRIGTGLAFFTAVTVAATSSFSILWSEMHTGILIFSNGSSITEAQAIIIISHAVTAVSGAGDFWLYDLSPHLPAFLGDLGLPLTLNFVFVTVSVSLIGGFSIAGDIVRTLTHATTHTRDAVWSALPVALSALAAGALLVVTSLPLPAARSPAFLLAEEWRDEAPAVDSSSSFVLSSLITHHGFLFTCVVVLTITHMRDLAIVARLCQQRLHPLRQPALLPLLAMLVNEAVGVVAGRRVVALSLLVPVCAALLAALCTHFYVSCAVTIAAALRLPLFTLPRKKQRKM